MVFIRSSRSNIGININVYKNNTCYIGKNNYFNHYPNKSTHLLVTEGKNIVIGDNNLFSFGLFIRTADPHIVYACSSRNRINLSRSIFIGDHVWIGQDALILKGATIGSGTIFGGHSVITGKKYFSNCAYGGNPVKLLKRDVYFKSACVNNYTMQQTANSMYWDNDDFIYNRTVEHVDQSDFIHSVDEELCGAPSAWKRFEILMEKIVGNKDKYRFVIQEPPALTLASEPAILGARGVPKT